MKEINEKKSEENSFLLWYNELPRTKKSKFILALQLSLEVSQAAVYYKLKKNSWRNIERDVVEQIINDGSWES